MPLTHDEIQTAVQQAGFFAWLRKRKNFPNQTVFCSDRTDGQYRGTSGYVLVVDNEWYLGSFGYRIWRIPGEKDVIPVVIKWLTSRCGPGKPSDEVLKEHSVQDFDDEWEELKRIHGFD